MRWVVLIALAACYSPRREAACTVACSAANDCPSGLTCNGGVCSDGDPCPHDANDDGPNPDAVCAGTAGAPLGQICFDSQPAERALAGVEVLDTGAESCRRDVQGVSVCVVPVSSIAAGAVVSATGPRPLVLWSSGAMQIDGILDGSSNSNAGRTGPGANPAGCASGPLGGTVLAGPGVGSGAAGGSFRSSTSMSTGGGGGSVTGGSGTTLAGGTPLPVTSALAFHGGCPGGLGGTVGAGTQSTFPGNGGGAVYIVAADGITLTSAGRISAGGGGGGGAKGPNSGGHGGGSGGWIVLDASGKGVSNNGVVAVFGGGGGSGGNASIPGNDGFSSFAAAGAGGPDATPCSNHGGNGSAAGGDTQGVGCGGGGGGGSIGLIQQF